MVDRGDLGQINSLYVELQSIESALDIFEHGGRINGMEINAEELGRPTYVDTRRLNYPQAMIDAIKSQLQTRRTEIESELADAGITGVSAR